MFNFYQDNTEYNECVTKGVCSAHPGVVALKEVILLILKQSSFYILKLKSFEYDTYSYERSLLCSLTSIFSGSALSNENLLSIISTSYNLLVKIRTVYSELCRAKNIKPAELKFKIKLTPDMSISDITAVGEKLFNGENSVSGCEKKYAVDLVNIILKNLSFNLVLLSEYTDLPQHCINSVLDTLNLQNKFSTPIKRYYSLILKLVDTNHFVLKVLSEFLSINFGSVSKTEVDFSSSKGKAVLVSGNSYSDLYKLLEYVQNYDIDVYTHDDLLTAHVYDSFKKFKNLKGHFGNCSDNCLLDFSTFPGAILLTKYFSTNLEYLYRGRLFTTADVIPKGVSMVSANDFSPVAISAVESKGFAKGQKRQKQIIGFDKNEFFDILAEISDKLKSGVIKRIVVIYPFKNPVNSILNFSKEFNDSDFITNFNSFDIKDLKNIYSLNFAYSNRMINDVLDMMFEYLNIDKSIYTFYFSICDAATISDIIYLHSIKFTNIFVSDCVPNIINPGLHKFIVTLYNLNKY